MMHDHEPIDYKGFRITSLWAFTMVGPDDEEGIIGAYNVELGAMMPLIASDQVRLQDYRPLAQEIANAAQRPVQLRKFVLSRNLETIEPRLPEEIDRTPEEVDTEPPGYSGGIQELGYEGDG